MKREGALDQIAHDSAKALTVGQNPRVNAPASYFLLRCLSTSITSSSLISRSASRTR